MPNPALVFSAVSFDQRTVNVVGRARASVIEEGINCLAQNPMAKEMIVSSGTQMHDIHLWECDPARWLEDGTGMEGSNKRQRTNVLTVDPAATFKTGAGV